MFSKIWEFIFRQLPIVKALDGHKTKISAFLIILSNLGILATKLSALFPQYLWLADLHVTLTNLQSQILDLLGQIGWGALAVGLADKEMKANS